jgi:hypothetical protein
MICPLCGYEFDCKKEGKNPCASCHKKSKDCSIVMCPNCGYSIADDLPIIKKIKGWFSKKK